MQGDNSVFTHCNSRVLPLEILLFWRWIIRCRLLVRKSYAAVF